LPFAWIDFIAQPFEKAKKEGDEMKKTRETNIDFTAQAFADFTRFGGEGRAGIVS